MTNKKIVESVEELVSSIVKGDFVEIQDALGKAMAEKLDAALEIKRAEMTANYFKNGEENEQ